MKDKFTKLKNYYNTFSLQPGSCFKITELGLYMPSNLALVREGLEILVERRLITTNDLFLDAGCGDGRIVALLAGIFEAPTVGVEYDQALFERSKNNIAYLQQIGVIGNRRAEIIVGDFKRDLTYTSQGIKFADFSVVFNYINNQKDIARKIANDSAIGTKFLLFDALAEPEELGGLDYVETLRLRQEEANQIHNPLESIMSTSYLHVYQK